MHIYFANVEGGNSPHKKWEICKYSLTLALITFLLCIKLNNSSYNSHLFFPLLSLSVSQIWLLDFSSLQGNVNCLEFINPGKSSSTQLPRGVFSLALCAKPYNSLPFADCCLQLIKSRRMKRILIFICGRIINKTSIPKCYRGSWIKKRPRKVALERNNCRGNLRFLTEIHTHCGWTHCIPLHPPRKNKNR